MKNAKQGNTEPMKEQTNYKTFDFYCLLFFILAFIGWAWEVLLYLFSEHAFINRGVYKGPYLPLYGAGGLLIYFCFHGLKKHPIPVFLGSFVLSSVLEYMTSWFLEAKWGIRWWDYSDHFLNINGRICLLGAFVFGVGGTVLVCLFFPLYEKMMKKVPQKVRVFLMILFLLIFVIDAAKAAIRPNMGEGISY